MRWTPPAKSVRSAVVLDGEAVILGPTAEGLRANKLVLTRLSTDGLEGARSADERPDVNQMA
jgi:hypothetical protein